MSGKTKVAVPRVQPTDTPTEAIEKLNARKQKMLLAIQSENFSEVLFSDSDEFNALRTSIGRDDKNRPANLRSIVEMYQELVSAYEAHILDKQAISFDAWHVIVSGKNRTEEEHPFYAACVHQLDLLHRFVVRLDQLAPEIPRLFRARSSTAGSSGSLPEVSVIDGARLVRRRGSTVSRTDSKKFSDDKPSWEAYVNFLVSRIIKDEQWGPILLDAGVSAVLRLIQLDAAHLEKLGINASQRQITGDNLSEAARRNLSSKLKDLSAGMTPGELVNYLKRIKELRLFFPLDNSSQFLFFAERVCFDYYKTVSGMPDLILESLYDFFPRLVGDPLLVQRRFFYAFSRFVYHPSRVSFSALASHFSGQAKVHDFFTAPFVETDNMSRNYFIDFLLDNWVGLEGFQKACVYDFLQDFEGDESLVLAWKRRYSELDGIIAGMKDKAAVERVPAVLEQKIDRLDEGVAGYLSGLQKNNASLNLSTMDSLGHILAGLRGFILGVTDPAPVKKDEAQIKKDRAQALSVIEFLRRTLCKSGIESRVVEALLSPLLAYQESLSAKASPHRVLWYLRQSFDAHKQVREFDLSRGLEYFQIFPVSELVLNFLLTQEQGFSVFIDFLKEVIKDQEEQLFFIGHRDSKNKGSSNELYIKSGDKFATSVYRILGELLRRQGDSEIFARFIFDSIIKRCSYGLNLEESVMKWLGFLPAMSSTPESQFFPVLQKLSELIKKQGFDRSAFHQYGWPAFVKEINTLFADDKKKIIAFEGVFYGLADQFKGVQLSNMLLMLTQAVFDVVPTDIDMKQRQRDRCVKLLTEKSKFSKSLFEKVADNSLLLKALGFEEDNILFGCCQQLKQQPKTFDAFCDLFLSRVSELESGKTLMMIPKPSASRGPSPLPATAVSSEAGHAENESKSESEDDSLKKIGSIQNQSRFPFDAEPSGSSRKTPSPLPLPDDREAVLRNIFQG